MRAEAVHAFADCGNEVLLLLAERRSGRRYRYSSEALRRASCVVGREMKREIK